jgi:hypothetical protein
LLRLLGLKHHSLLNAPAVLLFIYRDELGQARNRLLDGLKKLNETNNLVASMKADLARLQPELESKAAATADLLVKVRWCVITCCLLLLAAPCCTAVVGL